MSPFHFAILGLGKIARKFAEDLALIPDAKLVAVGSRSLERAQAFAKDFGAEHAAGTYAATFAGPRVDAVYIATPHVSHLELTLMCIERGIPVICEKPLGINLQQATSAVAAARASGVYLLEALWTRFLPSTLKLKELIDGGAIGSIESIRSDFGFRANDLETILPTAAPAHSTDSVTTLAPARNRILNPALGGGALLDIGIYPQFLAGGQLSHNYSTVLGRTKTEALILGSEASIHWHPRWHEPSSFSILRGKEDPPENFYFDYDGANGYKYEALAVMDDVRNGRTENALWSLDDSLTLHRTLTRVREQIGVRYPNE